jgi:hypothetical protein
MAAHAKHASYRTFLDNLQMHGEDEATKIFRLEHDCMEAVHAFAREHNIDCESWEGDTVDIIYDEGQWIKAKEAVSEIQRVLGKNDPAARYIFRDKIEAEKNFGTKGAVDSVSYRAGSLNAYNLVIGILKL